MLPPPLKTNLLTFAARLFGLKSQMLRFQPLARTIWGTFLSPHPHISSAMLSRWGSGFQNLAFLMQYFWVPDPLIWTTELCFWKSCFKIRNMYTVNQIHLEAHTKPLGTRPSSPDQFGGPVGTSCFTDATPRVTSDKQGSVSDIGPLQFHLHQPS